MTVGAEVVRAPVGAVLVGELERRGRVGRADDDLACELVGAWELDIGPVTRWRIVPDPSARVVEVRTADDWAALVSDHPVATSRPASWELPNVDQHAGELAELLAVPGQRAARTAVRRFLEPDWASVARRWDAVHPGVGRLRPRRGDGHRHGRRGRRHAARLGQRADAVAQPGPRCR